MSDSKLWTVSFVTLMFVNFLVALSFYLLSVKFVEFAIVAYAVSSSVASLTISVYVAGALATRVFLGNQIDRWGIRKALFIGFGLSAVCACLYLFGLSLPTLLIVRFAHGVGFGIGSGAAAAGAALVIPSKRQAEGVGYFSMSQSFAVGIGPFVAVLLTGQNEDYSKLFVFSAIMGVVALASLLFARLPVVERKSIAASKKGSPLQAFCADSFLQVAILPLTLVILVLYLCVGGVVGFLTLYAGEINLSNAAGLYFAVYAVSILITRPIVGKRVDKKGENSVVYFSIATSAVGFVILACSANGAMLLASAALIGFGAGATQSVLQAVVARATPPSQLGRANSTFFMGIDVGMGVGPVMFGFFVPFVGYQTGYLILACLAMVTFGLYHAVHGRKA